MCIAAKSSPEIRGCSQVGGVPSGLTANKPLIVLTISLTFCGISTSLFTAAWEKVLSFNISWNLDRFMPPDFLDHLPEVFLQVCLVSNLED